MSDWVVIFFRALGSVIMLFVITRILGKKQISQLTFFEYVTGIAIGDLVGFMSTDMESNYLHGIVALTVWFSVPFLLELAALKSKTLRQLLEGKGTVFIKEGKVLEDNLKRERYTGDELMEQLRTKNVFNVADVEFAILEASGDLSVLLKKENQPLTPKHLGLHLPNEVEPQTVIMDGVILDEPLSTIGFNRGYIQAELDKMGIPLENVFLAQLDVYGQIYLDLYDDQLKTPLPTVKELLYATLKKCEADIELFALGVKDESAKRMYIDCSNRLKRVLDDVKPLLTA